MNRSGFMLAGLFVLALPMFMWAQWSPDAFVHERLSAAGLDKNLSFDHIETTWHPGLHAQGVHARSAGGLDVHLEDVWLSPAWLQLLQVEPAVHICGQWQQQAFSLTLLSSTDGAGLRDIDIEMDSAQLKDHLKDVTKGMDMSPQGALHLRGGVDIAAAGVPTWADVNLSWENARIAIGDQQGYELGDYVFTIVSSGDAWRWTLKGGEQFAVSGSGTLQPAGVDPRQWGVQGSLEVEAEGMMGDVLTMVSGGAKHATALLTGTLAQPGIQWRK